ncbi:hypothetical protein GCM10010400_73420 [Streptomyces aculeolatus]
MRAATADSERSLLRVAGAFRTAVQAAVRTRPGRVPGELGAPGTRPAAARGLPPGGCRPGAAARGR